jgi:hypothetical protein
LLYYCVAGGVLEVDSTDLKVDIHVLNCDITVLRIDIAVMGIDISTINHPWLMVKCMVYQAP